MAAARWHRAGGGRWCLIGPLEGDGRPYVETRADGLVLLTIDTNGPTVGALLTAEQWAALCALPILETPPVVRGAPPTRGEEAALLELADRAAGACAGLRGEVEAHDFDEATNQIKEARSFLTQAEAALEPFRAAWGSACGEVGPGGQVCIKPAGHGPDHSDGSTLAASPLDDAALERIYSEAASGDVPPDVLAAAGGNVMRARALAAKRAVARAAVRDDWENPESESPWLAMAARNATDRNAQRERAERAEAERDAAVARADAMHGRWLASDVEVRRRLLDALGCCEPCPDTATLDDVTDRVAAELSRVRQDGALAVARAGRVEVEATKLRGELAITQGWLDRFQGDAAANYLKAWRLEQAARALVATLPKCDGLNAPGVTEECDRPATNAFERGGGRWCDEHRRRDQGGTPADDYPRAPALRALVTLLAAPEPTAGVGLPALALKAVRLWRANMRAVDFVAAADFAESMRALAAALDSPSGKEGNNDG